MTVNENLIPWFSYHKKRKGGDTGGGSFLVTVGENGTSQMEALLGNE